MKVIIIVFMLCVIFCGFCFSQRNRLMQMKKSIDMKLCADNDYSDDVIAKIDECNQMDPHFKIDLLYKECQDMVLNGGQNWNERRKLNCKVRDCYDQKYQSSEYNMTWIEIRKLSDFELEKRQIQKFECLEKVMSNK